MLEIVAVGRGRGARLLLLIRLGNALLLILLFFCAVVVRYCLRLSRCLLRVLLFRE